MKYLLLSSTLLLSILCNAKYRDASTFLRVNGGTFTIMQSITYNESNEPIDTVYSFMAIEKFPPYLHKSVKKELYYGSINEVYSFLKDVRNNFKTAEHGKKYLIDGMYATFSEQTFITHFIIENCSVQLTLLNKMMARLENKCRKNKIPLAYLKYTPIQSKKESWKGTVQVNSTRTVQDLHGMLLEWIANSYPYPKEVIQIDDLDHGFVCITGTTPAHTGSVFNIYEPKQHFRYKLHVWLSAGEYRYEVKQIYRVKNAHGSEQAIEFDTREAVAGSRKHQDIVNAVNGHITALVESMNSRLK